MAVFHLDARYATVFHEDLLDPCIGENLAAGRLDFWNYRVGNAPRPANRVVATVEIMPRNHRVRDERGALRRQAHVAPLAAQRSNEVLVVSEFAQDFPRPLAKGA